MNWPGMISPWLHILLVNLIWNLGTGISGPANEIQKQSPPKPSIIPVIHRNGISSQKLNPEIKTTPNISTTKSEGTFNYETAAATVLIQDLLRQSSHPGRNDRARMAPVPREVSYHDGETIATIQTDQRGNITRCSLFEIKRIEDSDRILAQFAMEKRPVQKINFRTMLSVITACQAIDPIFSTVHASLNNSVPYEMDRPQTPVDVLSMRSVISGILPGTKWCGLGDIAHDYEDLGTDKELDKCCRAHDHCPTKLRSFRSGYGLINWSLYTKSHCDCDSLLYECLKKAGGSTADLLGNFYFNVLRVPCIDDENPVKCMVRKRDTTCRSWAPSPNMAEKVMVFRDVRRQF